MAEGLVENLGGDYSEHEGILRGNSNIVKVWVEDEYDVPFWYELLNSCNSKYQFDISPYDNGNISKGKKGILKHVALLNNRFIACVDSDYEYLLDIENGIDEEKRKYVLNTYVYSIENYLGHGKALKNVCVNITKTTCFEEDFEYLISEYSKIIYPIFMWHLYWTSKGNTKKINLYHLERYICLDKQISSTYTIESYFSDLGRYLSTIHESILEFSRNEIAEFTQFKYLLESTKPIKSDNCYLFIQGHLFLVILEKYILVPVCKKLEKVHRDKIQVSNGSPEQKKMCKNHYNNINKVPLAYLINTNFEFKNHCNIYKTKLKVDIEHLIAEILQ